VTETPRAEWKEIFDLDPYLASCIASTWVAIQLQTFSLEKPLKIYLKDIRLNY